MGYDSDKQFRQAKKSCGINVASCVYQYRKIPYIVLFQIFGHFRKGLQDPEF